MKDSTIGFLWGLGIGLVFGAAVVAAAYGSRERLPRCPSGVVSSVTKNGVTICMYQRVTGKVLKAKQL